MKIELRERTEAHVRMYFERTRDPYIQKMCPQRARSVTEAIADFRKSKEVCASSFGRTVYADGAYVGDVWCFGLYEEDDPDAMIGYCLFDRSIWNRGVATEAVGLFLKEVSERFSIRRMGAFTYLENAASCRLLEKNGFAAQEILEENGVKSVYYLWSKEENR